MLIRILSLITNCLIPGSGLALLGYWRWAFITQGLLIISILTLCWTRWIFQADAIILFILVTGLIYLSSITCLFIPVKKTKQWLPTFGFMLLCLAGLAGGFIYKQSCLGVGIYFIPSMSMHPTLKPGEFILLDTWAYQNHPPQQKDVVVFQRNNQQQFLVKRIANWPDGLLTHNEQYYMLGDNPAVSKDSRHFGGIQQTEIIGKVKLILIKINHQHQITTDSYLTPVL